MKRVKNTTINQIIIKDVGVPIPASSYYDIAPQDYGIWAASVEIDSYINAGTIVINDGYDDLKPINGLRHIHEEGIPRPSAFITTASVIATTNSTLTLDASSRLLYIFTGSTSGQILKLGDARTYNIGHKYEVWNNSTTGVTLKNNSNTSIFIIAVAQKTWITLQDNSTQEGVWLIEANFMGGTGGGNGTISFGFDGTASTGRNLESLTNIPSNTTGYIIAGSKAIRSISIAGAVGATYTATITIYNNGVILDTITLSASRKNVKLNLNHILVNLDEVSAKVTSGSVARPVVILWL